MFLSAEQVALQQEIREFAETHLRGGLMRHTRGPEFPMDEFRAVAAAGYLGFMMPKEYGGAGNGVTEYCILLEEISRVDHNVAWTIDNTFGVASVIKHLGTDEQKQRFLPGLISGELIPVFALTDIAGGSSVKNMSTVATFDPDAQSFSISGRKVHLHNVDEANFWLVFASSADGSDALVVETPDNIRLGDTYQPFGFRCSPCRMIEFEGTRTPLENRLGEPGRGVQTAFAALNFTRIGNASIVIGITRAALEVALSYALGREVAGGVIADQQAVQHMLADIQVELDAASLLRWQAAGMHDSGLNPVREASEAKLYASEHGTESCGKLLRLLGAYGIYEDLPLSDYFASCKVLEIGSGASEIHRNNIAREVLKEYRVRYAAGELFDWATTPAERDLLALTGVELPEGGRTAAAVQR